MDLADSVIMPAEDFAELQLAAWSPSPKPTAGQRLGSTVQTIVVSAALSGAVAAACWGWAKAMDWREEKTFQRMQRDPKFTRPRPAW